MANLTKNARWVCALIKTRSHFTDKGRYVVFIAGRYPWSVPTEEALQDSLHLKKTDSIASTYSVDVAMYPYAKDWDHVRKMAERYFDMRLSTLSE